MEQQEINTENIIFNKKTFINISKEKLLDNYDVINEIEKNVNYTIYKVKNKKTNEENACKRLSKKLYSDNKDLIPEIKILYHCDYPNIINLYEIYEDSNYFYLILELCKGGELDDRIIKKIEQDNLFSEKEAVKIFKKIIQAIAYLHSNGICHRNLKPDNILFLSEENDSDLKLINFNLSTIFSYGKYKNDKNLELKEEKENKTRMKKLLGNAYFISPEMINGNYNEKCDIWSAGIILYFLLSGEPPFNGMNDEEIFSKVKLMKFSFPEKEWNNISNEAKDLIKKMICNENERLNANEILEHDWIKKCAPNSKGLLNNINIQCFKRYKNMHKIKRAIYTFIALRLSDDDTKNLKKIFKIIDDDNNGKISLSEMKDAFIRLNIKDYENEIENIFNSIDTDKSGMIDYTEFLSASINGNNEILSKKTLKDTFKLLDNDNSGKISKNNIMNVLKLENLNEKIIDNYINKYDLNKDGEIDYNEFLNMMENYLGKEEKKDNKEEKIDKTKEIKENEEKNKK